MLRLVLSSTVVPYSRQKMNANSMGRALSASLLRRYKRPSGQPLGLGDINIRNFTLAGVVHCCLLVELLCFGRGWLLKMDWLLFGQPT